MDDKESKQKAFEKVQDKLRELARNSLTYDEFINQIKTWPNWYLGKPIPSEMQGWTHKEFQQFYEENKDANTRD